MSQPATMLEPAASPATRMPWRATALWLAVAVAAFGVLFRAEVAAAIHVWMVSTAYNHCFLVLPIVAWLIWDRRARLRGLVPAPTALPVILLFPLTAAWLAAERLGIMEGRQLTALTMLEVTLLALLGWRLWIALMGPLLYLYFLVPFGEFLTPKLQDVTTWFTRHGLELLHIPAYIDGYVIEIPEGTFFVAEACAGLRFLIASIAFGALYALMMYRSPVRRCVFIALSIVVPIIANGFRALGIVVLGHILGSAEAGAADHVIYGWLFFSLVIVLLVLLGLPFRQDTPDADAPPASPAQATSGSGATVTAVAMIAAALGPILVMALNAAAAAPSVKALGPLDVSRICFDTGAAPPPAPDPMAASVTQQFNCGDIVLNIRIAAWSPRVTAGPINAARRALTRPMAAEDTSEAPVGRDTSDPLWAWQIANSTDPSLVAASALWIAGKPERPGLRTRIDMARTSILGTAFAPILVTIVPSADWAQAGPADRKRLADRLVRFLRETPDIAAQVAAMSARAGGGG